MAKSKMSKADMSGRFAELSTLAYKANQRLKDRRFYPMSHDRNGRLYEFGVYDYKTKRYVLECIHSPDAYKALDEMEAMLNNAS